VEPDQVENFEQAIQSNTKAIFAESIANPRLNVIDLEKVAAIARHHGIPLVIDNTLASPYLCQPLKHGADIVVHSATKYLGGHGTTMGGVVVESGRFPWDNGKFPDMVLPSEGYHGVRFYETFGDFGFTMKARFEIARTLGPTLSPMNAWLLLQGIETLAVRMDRICANALAIAQFLQSHRRVAWVNYPGLQSSPYYHLSQRYMPKGAGGILCFGVKGGAKAGEAFINAARFMSHLANVGDARSLIIHPASTTHRQLSESEQLAAGVPSDLIRMSVGIESLDDLLWDLDQALEATAS
jgi:O-acetylhomoserine (thiol)-lyase